MKYYECGTKVIVLANGSETPCIVHTRFSIMFCLADASAEFLFNYRACCKLLISLLFTRSETRPVHENTRLSSLLKLFSYITKARMLLHSKTFFLSHGFIAL